MDRRRNRERCRKEVLSKLARAGFVSGECLYLAQGFESKTSRER